MSEIHIEHNTAGTQFVGEFHAPIAVSQPSTQAEQEAQLQEALSTMKSEFEKLHPELDNNEKIKAERKLKLLTDEATQAEPDKEQLRVSGKGLIEAAQTCAKMAPPVISAVKTVLGLFGIVLP
jgi:hypothetical protein